MEINKNIKSFIQFLPIQDISYSIRADLFQVHYMLEKCLPVFKSAYSFDEFLGYIDFEDLPIGIQEMMEVSLIKYAYTDNDESILYYKAWDDFDISIDIDFKKLLKKDNNISEDYTHQTLINYLLNSLPIKDVTYKLKHDFIDVNLSIDKCLCVFDNENEFLGYIKYTDLPKNEQKLIDFYLLNFCRVVSDKLHYTTVFSEFVLELDWHSLIIKPQN